MRYVFITIYFFIFFLALVNCNPTGENGQDNQIPALSSISPESKVAHMPAFTLTAWGSNFVPGSQIVFNGAGKQTTFVSPTELTCEINSDDTVLTLSTMRESGVSKGMQEEAVPVLVRSPSPGGGDSNSLEFTIRDNHTFDSPVNISNNPGFSFYSDLAVDSAGNINVVWTDADNTQVKRDIYFSRSTDDGVSWSQVVIISNNSGNFDYPAIGVDSAGNIDVVWTDSDNDIVKRDIYFSRSTDGGVSWSQDVLIYTYSGDYNSPGIAVDSAGNINIVWWGGTDPGEILLSRSTDGGLSWSQVVIIANTSGYLIEAAAAVDSAGNINILWTDYSYSDDNYMIFFSRSTDGGLSWSQAVKIHNQGVLGPESFLEYPSIAIDSEGNINVAWEDFAESDVSIYFSRSTDGGVSWSQAINIFTPGGSYYPKIAVDIAGNINVVWRDYVSGIDIYFGRSIDDGVTWSQAINVSNTSATLFSCPAIAVDSAGNINIVWGEGGDSTLSTPANYEIYFTRSTR